MAEVLLNMPGSVAELANRLKSGIERHGYRASLVSERLSRASDLPVSAKVLVSLNIPLLPEDLEALPGLQAIVSPVLGYEWIDVANAGSRGIPVFNGRAPENYESMAEATIMLMLAARYDLDSARDQLRSVGPPESRPYAPSMLKGSVVGIVGYGNIARAVIARLSGWGVRILVTTRSDQGPRNGIEFVDLDALLQQSDTILLLSSLNDSSKRLIDRDRIDRIKPGAILVNTARGGLVDEAALAEAVMSGQIARVALDVFETEPLPVTSPLRTAPGAILTPHTVGHTRESRDAIPRLAVSNVLRILEGGTPPGLCNSAFLS